MPNGACLTRVVAGGILSCPPALHGHTMYTPCEPMFVGTRPPEATTVAEQRLQTGSEI
jgi:hypothetical protein